MEKKSKIKIATFWGIIFTVWGIRVDTSNMSGEGAGYFISLIIYSVIIPLIGIGLLTYVAGELYKGK